MKAAPPHPGKAKCIPAKPDSLLLPFQVRWVKDERRLKLAEKSRQIGWTWSDAYRWVSLLSLQGAANDVWISSRDEIQARLFLEDCKKFAAILQVAAADLGQQIVDDKGGTALVLQFANGRRINSMSSNPDAQAGKRGSRVIDEFALHPDQRKIYSIALPGITWGGGFEAFSTHRGSHSFFNQLITEIKHKGNPKGFSLHTVTLKTALDEGFLYKLQSKLPPEDERQAMDEAEYYDFIRASCADEETFLQEYMCVPSDDNAAFLSYELIQSCEYKPEEPWEWDFETALACQHPLYIGVDIGRDHDLTVIWIVEAVADQRLTRKIITLSRTNFTAQEEELYRWLRLPSVRRCCIDNTGLGKQFAERAIARFHTRVEAVTFTGPVKEELAYPVKSAFEDRSLRVPNHDLVRSDLRAIKKETTASGNVRFSADRGKNGHSDRFWALALAIHAGKRPRPTGAAGVIIGQSAGKQFTPRPMRRQ